jgi:hypothetical protein
MKPETPTPNLGPEKSAVQYEAGAEVALNPNVGKSEKEINVERQEQRSESNAVIADVGLTTIIPTPVANKQSVVHDTTSQSSPLVANYDDLIEKDWVDRAKKIVSETQNDPKQRDDRINVLKVDYVKKRFGRELGTAE